MATKITFIYDNPNDPAAFETDNPDLLAMAKAIPGFQCIQVSRVWQEHRSPTASQKGLSHEHQDHRDVRTPSAP